MGRPSKPIGPWVPLYLDAICEVLTLFATNAERGEFFHGFHVGASGSILWPRASKAAIAGHRSGMIARADSVEWKAKTSEAQRKRIQSRYSNREPPPGENPPP